MNGRLRRLAGRLGPAAAPRRTERARRLGQAQRVWLLDDVREDLAAMVDDAENRGLTGRAAGEMLAVRALVDWLRVASRPGSRRSGI